MRITKRIAREIAEDAALNSGFRIDLHSGYYELKNGFVMSINKEHIKDMSGKLTGQDVFAVYVSSDDPKEVCDWHYTESLDLDELANKIMEIYDGIGREVLA